MARGVVNGSLGQSRQAKIEGLRDVNFDYDYPFGLDLKPGSELHEQIVIKILERAQESKDAMVDRRETWDDIDDTMRGYIKLDKQEEQIRRVDKNRPLSIVLPVSVAARDALMSGVMANLTAAPPLHLQPTGTEDKTGAMLLQKVLEYQIIQAKMTLDLYAQMNDAYTYGMGIVSPVWERRVGWRTEADMWGPYKTGEKRRVEEVQYEGNSLNSIPPRHLFPDPTMPIHKLQQGEFVGWLEPSNRNFLLTEEKYGAEGFFNMRYLKEIADGRSQLAMDTKSGTTDTTMFDGRDSTSVLNPVDLLHMYVTLVPEEWKIGRNQYPEKWLFTLAGDSVLVRMQPLNLDHNMFPISVAAPNFTALDVSPISEMEIIKGLQTFANWLVNSHITNHRKVMNDMLVVDPQLVNIHDLKNPVPGGLIRLRKQAWGRGVGDAVQQLAVTDVTASNMAEVGMVQELVERATGATQSMMGMMRAGGERRSAQESRDTRHSAISRADKDLKISSIMAHADITFMCAKNIQQLMEEEVFVQLTGTFQEELEAEYGPDVKGARVDPLDLLVGFDVIPSTAANPGGEFVESWVQMFQAILSSPPELAMQFDLLRMMKHIGRITGVEDIHEFANKNPQMPPAQVEVQPDQQVQEQAQAGNLVPMEEFAGGY